MLYLLVLAIKLKLEKIVLAFPKGNCLIKFGIKPMTKIYILANRLTKIFMGLKLKKILRF